LGFRGVLKNPQELPWLRAWTAHIEHLRIHSTHHTTAIKVKQCSPIAPRCRVRYSFDQKWTRNSSGDEIANVNFLYDDIVHVIHNTIDSCINSASARRGGYVLERMFTKFIEITQCNGHYAVQDHSRSPILVPIERSYTTSY